MKVDMTKKRREAYRRQAIEFGKMAVEDMLKDHKEPIRAGKRRGDLIGLSRKKKRAACLMVLHNPPLGLTLKEIARIAGVSLGVLLLWRMEDPFKKEEAEACKTLGETIRNTIANQLEGTQIKPFLQIKGIEGRERDFLLQVLPFFNPAVSTPLIDLLISKKGKSSTGYAGTALLLMMHEAVRDEKSLKRWRAQPWQKDLTRTMIKSWIDDISNPEARKAMGPRKYQEMVDEFKRFVLSELDLQDNLDRTEK